MIVRFSFIGIRPHLGLEPLCRIGCGLGEIPFLKTNGLHYETLETWVQEHPRNSNDVENFSSGYGTTLL